MRIHAELSPGIELFVQNAPGVLRLQTERMAAQVDDRRVVRALREAKRCAKRAERIVSILLFRVAAIEGRRHAALNGIKIGRLGAASVANGAICKLSKYAPSWIVFGTYASSVTVAYERVSLVTDTAPGGRFQKRRWAVSLPWSFARSSEGRSVTRCLTPRATIQRMASAEKNAAGRRS